MTHIVVFTGTSLSWEDAGLVLDADYRPPVKRNDINILLDKSTPDIIGIIDGIFFDRAAVAHREILRALRAGVTVVGGCSMGALRASELDTYNMIGVGRIYEWYRDGVIESDDEVAVTFHPETLEALSIPLVNIRVTLERAVEQGAIAHDLSNVLLETARSMYYPDRTFAAIVKRCVENGHIPKSDKDTLIDYFIHNEVDVKREDALLVIEMIKELVESF
ncbi:MAG: TfuA-related McrA-glycine thioamidation protein [ANME-2 cluster archaeon]|nr:TfuA-related McrA-glycine thioamidation protein [ANME-2 cluster archaeon]